jgi:hypothetical protein
MTLSDLVSAFARYKQKYNNIDITQNCGLAKGTNVHTIKTQNQVVFNLYNQQITLAATNNIAMTACSAQAVSTFCYYVVSVDVNSTVYVTKGTDNTYAIPEPPAGTTAIGCILVSTDGTHPFTSGTTDLAATGITASYYDIDCGVAVSLIELTQKRIERGVTIVRNGKQITIMDFDYMLRRADNAVVQGDSSIILPYPGFKDFQTNGLTITDSSGMDYPMEKYDMVETGIVFQSRPLRISRLPSIETVFNPEGLPAREFDIWPEADQAYTIDTIAYCYSPALDGILYHQNWLSIYAPDALLFGALIEGNSFFALTDPRSAEWEKRWSEAMWTLYQAQQKQKYAGTFIYTKYPVLKKRESLGMSSNKAGIYSFGFYGS